MSIVQTTEIMSRLFNIGLILDTRMLQFFARFEPDKPDKQDKPDKPIEIVVNLEVECYKKKARQNLEYKVFTFRFIHSWLALSVFVMKQINVYDKNDLASSYC